MKKVIGSKMKIEIPIGKGRPTKPIQSANYPMLGIIAPNILSLLNRWKELTREDKDAALIRCHRYKLKQQFESARSMEEARKMEVEQLTSGNWNKLCDIWNDLEAKSNMKDLKPLCTSGESSMTIDDIVDAILGTKLGYIKSLGYVPKPNTTRATQRRTIELEDSLKKAKLEVASAQNELKK
ncbi:hypothetical protein FXO37_34392 [Capsicum annuum]|nr:hypothetical protein FXO37_34392 [Capsicum annuum]